MELEIAGHIKKVKTISQEALEEAISELEDPVRRHPQNFNFSLF